MRLPTVFRKVKFIDFVWRAASSKVDSSISLQLRQVTATKPFLFKKKCTASGVC